KPGPFMRNKRHAHTFACIGHRTGQVHSAVKTNNPFNLLVLDPFSRALVDLLDGTCQSRSNLANLRLTPFKLRLSSRQRCRAGQGQIVNFRIRQYTLILAYRSHASCTVTTDTTGNTLRAFPEP